MLQMLQRFSNWWTMSP